MAASAFGLGRKCWSSPQCCLHAPSSYHRVATATTRCIYSQRDSQAEVAGMPCQRSPVLVLIRLDVQGESKKFILRGFLKIFHNGWEFLTKILHTYCVYAKLQNFIHLPLTLTKSLGHPSKFQRVLRLGGVTSRHSSSGCQPKFVALDRGRHLYSAGRPSRWTLAHILV